MKPVFLAITSGDRDGVGLEVACKALTKLGPQRAARFAVLCADDEATRRELKKLRGFRPVVLSSRETPFEVAAKVFTDLRANEILIWLDTAKGARLNEAQWVETCAKLALRGEIDGLVTGPVSKGRFKRIRSNYMGHTGMLAHLAKTPVQQGYIGAQLTVVLATDHVALRDVERALDRRKVMRAIENAKALLPLLPARTRRRPISVLGLNPHAGEDGLIGTFETKLRLPKKVRGPVPADTAFTAAAREKLSVVVALYHDQGLIPFKLLHGQDSGFQVSLGLPFVRTSVDHGTARDIFGRNQASPGSMIDAIRGAVQLAQARKRN